MARRFATRRGAVLLVLLLAAVTAAIEVAERPPSALFQRRVIAPRNDHALPGIESHFVSRSQNIHTHAASVVELGDGRIRAFWFAGTREGAGDVDIRSAVFDPARDRWGAEQRIANRVGTQRALLRYVKKLGNPVAHRATDGTLWLFYVTVSLGGWGGSSITAVTSTDDGANWSPARRLITTPFINISTLVKGTPFDYSDGSIGLPVYHQFIGKFGELLRISKTGAIIDKSRLSAGKTSLQPVVLIKHPRQALALMRYSGASPRRVIETRTDDGGRHWSPATKTTLANPNSAISGVVLTDGRILMAVNDTERGRETLSLVISADDGASWKTLYTLEDQRDQPGSQARYGHVVEALAKATDAGIGVAADYARSAQRSKCTSQRCSYEFSYPYLIQARNGDFHLVYTWNRSFIKHVWFTPAWLSKQSSIATGAQRH